ncbi:zinc-dependent peptidase [uncultured Planktosalinus sp.]|uniref:zinc-dependent peptidase n=1 Tax=uncultured Planktosalinus sp. TaxID=1810935 RepID=UPI0030D9A56F
MNETPAMDSFSFMLQFLAPEDNQNWLAPYAYGIVFLGIFLFLFRVFEHHYTLYFDKPLLRHYFVYRKLNTTQKSVLRSEFSFYNKLSKKHKRQFEHRVATFIKTKHFIGRDGFHVDDIQKVLISAVGCMLSFGRKNYNYGLIESVLVYPGEFYSKANDAYHKGEFNPKHKVLALSWEDFEKGYEITNDNLNLGIHEFMHAMQLEAMTGKDPDSARFMKHFKNILKRLTNQELKDKLDNTRFFRAYAFTNQYEFMAVLAEYFFESPTDLKQHFPELYKFKKKMLNFNFADY